jgi:O-antigen ligase
MSGDNLSRTVMMTGYWRFIDDLHSSLTPNAHRFQATEHVRLRVLKRLYGSFDEAMKRWSSAQLLRSSEFVYATVVLFALTQGPVYRLWSASANEAFRLPNPSVSHAEFATFVALQLPALVLWFRRLDARWLRQSNNVMLTGLLGWLTIGVMWSTFARHSLPEVVALLLTTAFGLYLATTFSLRQFLYVVAGSMALGVSLSWLAVMRLWEDAVNFQDDYWIGIYYNRNSLAPVTAVAVIVSVWLLVSELGRRDNGIFKKLLVAVAAPSLAAFAAVELWQSKSRTSPLAMAVAALLTAIWVLVRLFCQRVKLLNWAVPHSAAATVSVGALGFFFALRGVGDVLGIADRVPSLIPRQVLWSLSWSGFLEKPWHGWGWMAAWRTPEFFNADASTWLSAWDSSWAHNGYHDLLLGGGIVAALLFFFYMWFGIRKVSVQPLATSVPKLLLVVFVLAAATQESFFIGSHFIWALLVAALVPSSARTDSVEQQEPDQVST